MKDYQPEVRERLAERGIELTPEQLVEERQKIYETICREMTLRGSKPPANSSPAGPPVRSWRKARAKQRRRDRIQGRAGPGTSRRCRAVQGAAWRCRAKQGFFTF